MSSWDGDEPATMDVNDPGQEPGDSILDAVNEAFEPRPQGSPPADEDRPDHGSDDRPDHERPEPPRTREGARGGPATPRRGGPAPGRPAAPESTPPESSPKQSPDGPVRLEKKKV